MQVNDTIGYWLAYAQRCHAAAFFEVLRTHCAERGKAYVITPPQWALMALLLHKDGQTIGALAQAIGIDAPAITSLTKRLEQSNLVMRTRDREDQRVVIVSLTDEGWDIIRTLDPVVTTFNQEIFPDEQRQAFLEQLQHLIASTSAIAPGAGDRFGILKRYELGLEDHPFS